MKFKANALCGISLATLLICSLNLGIGIFYSAFDQQKQRSNLDAFVSDPDFPREPRPRPPLHTIVQGWNVVGDPSWLLNVAIVGFPKCGTSTLMFHFESHPEIQIFTDERCDMSYNQHVKLIHDLYQKFPAGDFVRAIKCPMDLENTVLAMEHYQQFFPKTDFIVGIRHPVLWFESFYNFRIHNEFHMPPADELIGKCRRGFWNVCTFRSNFHLFLSNLAKTNALTDPNEYQYIDKKFQRSMANFSNPHRRVFLYEVSQLSSTEEYESIFRRDLQRFLHLNVPIPPMIWVKPGVNHTDEHRLEKLNSKKIDICDNQYNTVRGILMAQAINASRWIRTYFVHAPGVFVSSKQHFVNDIMLGWEQDPCIERRRQAKETT